MRAFSTNGWRDGEALVLAGLLDDIAETLRHEAGQLAVGVGEVGVHHEGLAGRVDPALPGETSLLGQGPVKTLPCW
jgi:hypothetical protein